MNIDAYNTKNKYILFNTSWFHIPISYNKYIIICRTTENQILHIVSIFHISLLFCSKYNKPYQFFVYHIFCITLHMVSCNMCICSYNIPVTDVITYTVNILIYNTYI